MSLRIRSNLFGLLQEIEKKNHRKYSWSYISKKIGISRQATKTLFMSDPTKDNYIKYGTMAGLIEFFRGEGLDVSPDDLFPVTLATEDNHALNAES